jgi:hypothetical protein
MAQAKAHFLVAAWDERLCKEDEHGRRLTRVTIHETFQGDIEGEGVSQYLMTYAPDGTAAFNGLQTIEGRIGGKTGLLMLRLSGDFDGRLAHGRSEVLFRAGAGELSRLTGAGEFEAPLGHPGDYRLSYELH